MKNVRQGLNDSYSFAQHSFVKSIVLYPICHCLVQWFILLSIATFIGAGGYFTFSDLGLSDFTIIEEQDTQNFLAIDVAVDLAESGSDFDAAAAEFRSEAIFPISFAFLFTVSSGDLFTSATVQEICQVERLATGQELFPFYCLTDAPNGTNTDCSDFGIAFSISANFYENKEDRDACIELDQEFIDNIFSNLSPVIKDFIVDDDENPTVARSLISLAGPLGPDSPPGEAFEEVFVDFDEVQVTDGYQPLMESFVDDLFEFYNVKETPLKSGFYTEFFQKSSSTLQTQTGGVFLDVLGFLDVINVDQALSTGSYVVVLFVMMIYLRSCLMPCLSMISIAISLMVGLFLFAIVLQIDYFTPLNILVLFLIAGVGADNVFVLADAWRQSEEEVAHLSRDETENIFLVGLTEEQKTRYLRLNYAYGRAALSVSHTAMTTFIAFAATVVSPISVIAGLGLYGSLVILANLWYMFTVHPVNLMFWYHVTQLCCSKKVNPIIGDKTDKEKKELEVEEVVKEKKNSFLDKMFASYIFMINETCFPYVALCVMFSLSIFMIHSTSQLETPSALESNFPEGHMFADFTLDFNNLFTSGTPDSFTFVNGVFGILDLDVGNLKKLSGDSFQGDPVFDEDFEIFTERSQNFILQVCDELADLPCEKNGCTQNTLVLQDSIECPLIQFQDFLLNKGFNSTFVDSIPGAIPSNEDFLDLLLEFLAAAPPDISALFGVFDGRLQFLMLTYRMSMIANQPLGIKTPVIEEFDNYTRSVRKRAPPSMKSFFQSSFDHVWQHTERAFVSGLFTGLMISLSASFVVLLIGTKNPRVACFAIAGVTGVVCSVLGTVRFMPNFALGTAETIAGVFVIGLAIDYIVHLGHMFMHSRHYLEGSPNPAVGTQRIFSQTGEIAYQNKDMIAFAVQKMGVTVLAGAVTTFSSAAFLSLCTFVFFRKMSVLLMFTIFYSVSYAFLFFLPMLRVFGPGRRDAAHVLMNSEKKVEEKSVNKDTEEVEKESNKKVEEVSKGEVQHQ